MKALSSISPPSLTSAQIAALPTGTGRFPPGSVVYDSTLRCPRINMGTDAAQLWGFFGDVVLFDVVVGRGNATPWADPAAPAATLDSNTILGGNISPLFATLGLEMYLRGDTVAAEIAVSMQFNGDTGSNYDWQTATFTNSTANAPTGVASGGSIGVGNAGVPAASAPAGSYSATTIDIQNYAGTTGHKTVRGHGFEKRSTAGPDFMNNLFGGVWRSTAAINRILLTPSSGSFVAGSRLRLVGKGLASI